MTLPLTRSVHFQHLREGKTGGGRQQAPQGLQHDATWNAGRAGGCGGSALGKLLSDVFGFKLKLSGAPLRDLTDEAETESIVLKPSVVHNFTVLINVQ